MKKKILILFVLSVLVISILGILNFIIHEGEFNKVSHSSVLKKHFEGGEAIYLGYRFIWEGLGEPMIEQIEFFKKDGTIVAENDDEFRILPFIEEIGIENSISSMDEKNVISQGTIDNLVTMSNFRVKGDFNLILRVEFHGDNSDNDISRLRLTYKKFGLTLHQEIPFEDGVIVDLE